MLNILKTKKEVIFLFLIAVLFLAIRIPGIHIPYHQDEYKWPLYSNEAVYPPGSVPHPPLTELIYRVFAPHFGYDNFRMVPLMFSFVNIFLLFYLGSILFDRRTALWLVFIFTVTFYSVLASLMIDVDGAVMPFFFLLSVIGYIRWKRSEWKDWKWLGILALSAICGFLVKVVFVILMAALAFDFAIEMQIFKDKNRLMKYALWLLGGGLALVFIMVFIRYIFPFFDLSKALKYWEHFANSSSFLDRGWFQTFIQFVKSILYTSPLLLLLPFLIDQEIFKKVRPLIIFIVLETFFYLFVFDFSIGALDRYFEFLIVPLCIISGAVISKYQPKIKWDDKLAYSFVAFTIVVFLYQFMYQFVPALYPKSEWIGRVLSFRWNFLYPFSGGSGPLTFYISFAFIGMIWIVSFAFFFVSVIKKMPKERIVLVIMILGLTYNMVFIEEYLFGKINGNSTGLVQRSVEYIKNNNDIHKVIVYNDNGGFNIQNIGKYERRMYAVPGFEQTYLPIFNNFKGHVLYVDAPKMMSGSIYEKYINSCNEIYSETDKYISAKVYDCSMSKI